MERRRIKKTTYKIYGISFPKQKELSEYLTLLEEAKKRDHRKLGKELELFTFSKKSRSRITSMASKEQIFVKDLKIFLKMFKP